MKGTIGKISKFCLCAALVLHATACGTLMHPERKGQTEGRVDGTIMLLDGIGIIFGIIPGVIAYAVDLTNGTIYLPKGSSNGKKSVRLEELRKIPFDLNGPRVTEIETILSRESGRQIHLAEAKGFFVRLKIPQQLPSFFAGARLSVPDMVVSEPASPSSGR